MDIVLRDGRCHLVGVGDFPSPNAALHAAQLLAMDEAPNRTITPRGAMHVRDSNISKANVCEYFGREIPRYQMLGLNPDRKYKLLRHPEELKKAAPSFNNLPILAKHAPVTADDHQPHLIIGTTGTDAKYAHPFMKNSTSFWAGGAINAINGEDMNELSSSYDYDPDMTPGTYEGEAYDGVMRNLVGNHVALVRKGRAGDDVLVGDSKPEEFYMSKAVLSRTALYAAGATQVLLASKLAMDEKPIDTSAIFEGVTTKNWGEMKPKVVSRVTDALKGVTLAKDASMEDIVKMVDMMEKPEVAEGADADPETGAPLDAAALSAAMMDPGAADIDVDAKRREFLAGKLSPDDMTAYDAFKPGCMAGDDDPENPNLNMEKELKIIDKPAMDEAIKVALEGQGARLKAARAAEIAVRPWVGDLTMAFDSAEEVHRKALDVLGVKHKSLHADALFPIIQAQPRPGAKPAARILAMDATPSTDFNTRFPDADRIGMSV